MDDTEPCPILWAEIANGVCEAPTTYTGKCHGRLDVGNLSQTDKQTLASTCGFRWPCQAPPARDYGQICPEGWQLKLNHICRAPSSYTGPCDATLEMRALTRTDKLRLEADCEFSWPALGAACRRDYTAPCPFGWLEVDEGGEAACHAPASSFCARAQRFTQMTPAEKQDWEALCGERFPCSSRSACPIDWTAPCPADWYNVGDGRLCLAPTAYKGGCATSVAPSSWGGDASKNIFRECVMSLGHVLARQSAKKTCISGMMPPRCGRMAPLTHRCRLHSAP